MMRLTSRFGPRRIGKTRARRRTGRRTAWGVAVLPVLITVLLVGCQPSPSFERESNGRTIYLDQLSEAAKAKARQQIESSLSHGVSAYELGVGDEVDLLFHIDRRVTAKPYTIVPGDKLSVDILGDTANSGTVQVLPDGRVFLPLIGAVRAAGRTAEALGRELQERYSKVLTGPQVTVNVTTSHSLLDDFLAALGSSAKGRVLSEKVLPDGTMALPLLSPVRARGRTMTQLTDAIDSAYAAKGLAVSVSIIPRSLQANAALVIGEVGKPGRIELQQPTTVAMAVAQAGGVSTAGAMDAVRVFYIAADGTPRIRSINLNEVLNGFKLEDDMIVPRNSIIYVPPTELAKTGRFMSSVMRDILRVQGFNIGGGYSIQ